jgi:hypothetical protein
MCLSLAFDPPPQPVDIPTQRDSPICPIAEIPSAEDIHSPAIEKSFRDRYQQYQFSADDDEKLIQHEIYYIFNGWSWQISLRARGNQNLLEINHYRHLIFGKIKSCHLIRIMIKIADTGGPRE